MKRYNPKEIEPRWAKIWDETGVYTADLNSARPKYIGMSMFNYPSGAGIHIGHAMNYTISDVKARFKRQQGYESYHPVGWDAFGLPAENYAIKTGVSPQESMATIIPSYHKQYKAMGWSNDWEKEISTHLPEYYKWSQWIFTQMYKHGLAYQDSRMQWWCSIDNTVLANEQVINGKCWRHDGPGDPPATKKEIKQWFFKITDYADELLEATDSLDWTDSVKLAQKNWIGKSVGAEIDFQIEQDFTETDFVFLHGFGWGHEGAFWPWLTKEIVSRGGKVFAPDLPNFKQADVEEQARYVLENYKFTKNTVIVTHSLGGAVAMKLLPQLKSSIKSLIMMAPLLKPEFKDNKKRPEIENASDWKFDFDQVKSKVNQIKVILEKNDLIIPSYHSKTIARNLGAEWAGMIGSETHFDGQVELAVLSAILSSVRVFTTRADTIFGATFLVLAPEHELVSRITTNEQKKKIDDYIKKTSAKSELERQESKEKTGVFTGAYAINPANNEKIPIWIADYVLTGYGTGAIMAVPAHDERDHEFAQKFNLPIVEVVAPDFGTPLPDPVDVTGPVIIGYDPKTKQFMSLINTKNDMRWFASGGLKDGETYETAAYRELGEEAGYHKVKKMIQLGGPTYSYYYNSNKDSNRRSFSYMFLAIIDSSEKIEQHLEAHEKYRVEWSDADTISLDFQKEPDGRGHWIDGMERARDAASAYDGGKDYVGPIITGEGVLFNSGRYNGLATSEAREKIVADLAKQGVASEKINYRMRDWSVSRQRYWGAPIPIIYCEKCGPQLVPNEDLPVILPELTDYAPAGDGRSALARASDWVNTTCPRCKGPAERETDSLDTYVDSSFYMLRYLDPHNQEAIFGSKIVNKWAPIDFYNGGDHATAHMLYARFITRFFNKIGLIDNPEPFKQFLFNGKVTAKSGEMFSKSKGNGIDPLEIIDQGYGADALRTYLMFAAPLELWIRWDPQGVPGTYRFLNRLWNLVQEFLGAMQLETRETAQQKILHSTNLMIKKVTEDIEGNRYNTAIAAMMECVNDFYKLKVAEFGRNDVWRQALESLVACVAPFAPFMADELWQQLGHSSSVHRGTWPKWDEKYLASDTATIAVQINGKLRGTVAVAAGSSEDKVANLAKNDTKVATYLEGRAIVKTIYVADKLINFVVR